MKAIRIIIVDDHKIFRDGLKMNLSDNSDEIIVIGDTDNYFSLTKLLETELPDILLLDYQMPEFSGVQITRKIVSNPAWANIKMIIISAHTSQNIISNSFEFVIKALDAGIQGYLLKDSNIQDIITAIKEVFVGNGFFMGESFNHKEISKCLIKERNHLLSLISKQRNFGLSKREIEVIKYLSEGYSAKEIGSKLFITDDSVTTHKDKIKQKLSDNYNIKLKNTVELVVWAIKNNIIEI